MHSLFQQSYNTALLNMDNKNTKEPVQSKKLDALEAELRSETKEQKTELNNELAGAAPCAYHRHSSKTAAAGTARCRVSILWKQAWRLFDPSTANANRCTAHGPAHVEIDAREPERVP